MLEHPGLTKLRALLADTPVVLTYREEYIGFPGGGYTNRQIGANGEWFCADLTDRNPYVTEAEIRRTLC